MLWEFLPKGIGEGSSDYKNETMKKFVFMWLVLIVPPALSAAAVLKSMDNSMNTEDIKGVIAQSARDAGDWGYDEYYGYGILDIQGCIKHMLSGKRLFISPIDIIDDSAYALIYNNTGSIQRGNFTQAEFEENRLKQVQRTDITLNPNKGAVVKAAVSENIGKYFVWENSSIESISNEREY